MPYRTGDPLHLHHIISRKPPFDRFWWDLAVLGGVPACPLLSAFLPHALHNGLVIVDPFQPLTLCDSLIPERLGKIMDIQTTVQLLGNLGEFIAAIAVVVTLIYVAAQVKHGKAAFDANTEAIRREYENRAQEALNDISEWVAQASRPRVQDADLAQIWLDGLSGKELSEVDEFRFGSMMHEDIWQSVTMHGRMLALGRSELGDAHVQTTALHINRNPGYRKYWDLNRGGLTTWGYGDLVQAVEVAVRAKSAGESSLDQWPDRADF